MDFLAILAALLPLILNILEQWQSQQPARKEQNHHDQITALRTAIAGTDPIPVSIAIDRLCEGPGDPPKLGDDQDTARRLTAITGL